jgi:hypothetical protein
MYTQLMQASSQRDPALVDEVVKLLRFERQTWSMVLEQLAQENKAAGAITAIPDAQPPLGTGPAGAPSDLIGGTVSVRG